MPVFELGIASSSKNARIVLEQSGLLHCFSAIMDGLVAEQEHVRSKPSPEFYQHAAFLLGREPHSCIVIEDAVSGVVSAKQAGARLIVGIARGCSDAAPASPWGGRGPGIPGRSFHRVARAGCGARRMIARGAL